jgi:hypothetical protein
MDTTYKRPRTVAALRILGLLCFAVMGVQIIASAVGDGPADLGGGSALIAGLCFWVSSAWLDYTARTAFHAERAADSLLRMEWAHKNAVDSAKRAASFPGESG